MKLLRSLLAIWNRLLQRIAAPRVAPRSRLDRGEEGFSGLAGARLIAAPGRGAVPILRAPVLRAVFFDIDGTLIDSNDAHARAWAEALAEYGFAAPWESLRCRIGMGGDKIIPAIAGFAAETPLGKAIADRRGAIFLSRHLPTLKPFAGARELLEFLRAEGLQLFVTSSAGDDELEPLLAAAGVADLIERNPKSRRDRSKPDPDILLGALRRSGRQPHEVVLVGDTPYDVEAAARSQIAAIALRCGGWRDRALSAATAIVDDPAELLRRFDHTWSNRGRLTPGLLRE